ncbi:MAG: flagellar basal body rod protein FlgB [Bacillota bacterium]|uniref:Flagellar basal body rod protein FlgB n=1 Tax=[Clostridium] aminophilum TaxID=1526 RepID=A0A1I6IUU1_9FIRM|nr:flagellar basal body rod protein FlgB [[Clostridium] aminophilum]MDT3844615.1 flagellar basal body rod protein FlgB [Bacillota bacterium]SET87367.1 flagellar basal-body rod protein FlgB [[Clostridium] aminophilum]SFR70522.1 flagellar basal-body rod protein FlgB [[Clostridium] aminophilum]
MVNLFGLYGNGVALSERTLDYLWGRQNITLNNIANVDTPGYKSRYMTFEDTLAKSIRAAQTAKGEQAVAQAISSNRPSIHITNAESTRLDGNNVDMDQEQVDLVKTAYEYQYMVQSINNDLNRLRASVKGF